MSPFTYAKLFKWTIRRWEDYRYHLLEYRFWGKKWLNTALVHWSYLCLMCLFFSFCVTLIVFLCYFILYTLYLSNTESTIVNVPLQFWVIQSTKPVWSVSNKITLEYIIGKHWFTIYSLWSYVYFEEIWIGLKKNKNNLVHV